MNEPTQEQISAAKAMGVDLNFGNIPLAIARMTELIANLEMRIAELEQTKRASWRK